MTEEQRFAVTRILEAADALESMGSPACEGVRRLAKVLAEDADCHLDFYAIGTPAVEAAREGREPVDALVCTCQQMVDIMVRRMCEPRKPAQPGSAEPAAEELS